jgi:serine/threonine protein kinase
MQEFLNLRDLRHCQDIIQLINAVVSPNPYHTGISDVCKPVLRGFLLEHHEAGTLDAALGRGSYRSRWAFQIAHGLQQMHRKRIAHMDLKPTNIVISSKDDANIIDVSGLAVTREWLAPEFQEHLDPSALPWDSRVRNIYGHLASSSQRWYNLNMIQRRLPSSQE